MRARGCKELSDELGAEQYKIFCVDSSLVLCEYVIAKDINKLIIIDHV